MVSLPDGGDYAANVFAILDDGLTDCEVLERNLVSDGYILVGDAAKLAVILGHNAEHVRTGGQIFDDDHADVVAAVVHEKVRYFCHGYPEVN
jgi:hypothetical protein